MSSWYQGETFGAKIGAITQGYKGEVQQNVHILLKERVSSITIISATSEGHTWLNPCTRDIFNASKRPQYSAAKRHDAEISQTGNLLC